MKKVFSTLWLGVNVTLVTVAQDPAFTGTTLIRSAYTNRSLHATTSIELQPGFSVTTHGFQARILEATTPSTQGNWSGIRPWAVPGGDTIVGIHTHVLPNGKVLSWEGHNGNNLVHGTHALTWDPVSNLFEPFDNHSSNVFCSGHAFLPDGRLLVAGGHYGFYDPDNTDPNDGGVPLPPTTSPPPVPSTATAGYIGIPDANAFNFADAFQASPSGPAVNPWQSLPPMQDRRWYPTATTLPNGEVLVTSGQMYALNREPVNSTEPEVYNGTTNTWRKLTGANNRPIAYYPWMFVAPNGKVFNAGPDPATQYLNTTGLGAWEGNATNNTIYNSNYPFRNYGSAVMYAPGKIMIVGGGVGYGTWSEITNSCEVIDLTVAAPDQPAWRTVAPMSYPRRHGVATLLPDGMVLVTGGMTWWGNDDGHAVLPAELWTPPGLPVPTGEIAGDAGEWTTMAAMQVPRLYHSTAVLLPDARVLCTGGGQGDGCVDHRDYEIFSPPYLFKGARPQVIEAPAAVTYAQGFAVTTGDAPTDAITEVRWIRLPSVTHAIDMNQRSNVLDFRQTGAVNGHRTVSIRPPGDPNECPPGHYMLFLLNANGVPSVARIVSIGHSSCTPPATLTLITTTESDDGCESQMKVTASYSTVAGNFRWTIDGVHEPNFDDQDHILFPQGILLPNKSSHVIGVVVDSGCGGTTPDPPLSASTVVTSYFPNCEIREK